MGNQKKGVGMFETILKTFKFQKWISNDLKECSETTGRTQTRIVEDALIKVEKFKRPKSD